MTEAELKQAILTMAYARGWLVYHVPATTIRNGGVRGYPDLTLARNGIALWLELKTEKGTVTEQQEAWKRALPYSSAYIVRPSDLPQVARLLR